MPVDEQLDVPGLGEQLFQAVPIAVQLPAAVVERDPTADQWVPDNPTRVDGQLYDSDR
jgi:hypothetical protein